MEPSIWASVSPPVVAIPGAGTGEGSAAVRVRRCVRRGRQGALWPGCGRRLRSAAPPGHRPVPASSAGKQTWPTSETRRTLSATWATTCHSCPVTSRGRTLAAGRARPEPRVARRRRAGGGAAPGSGRTAAPGLRPSRGAPVPAGSPRAGGEASQGRGPRPFCPPVLRGSSLEMDRRGGPGQVSSHYFSGTSSL